MCVQKEISKHFEGIEDHVKWGLNTIFINTARNDTEGRKERRKERKGKEGGREDGFGPSRSCDGVKWRDFSILRVFSCIIKMQRYGRVIDAMNIPLT